MKENGLRILLAISALALLALGASQSLPEFQANFREKSIKDYRTWAKATPKPVKMGAPQFALCDPSSQVRQGDPHASGYYMVYVNSIGKQAMASKGSLAFPVGSVLVKEKANSVEGDGKLGRRILLTVMIKHKKGFDRANGDWEFFACDDDAKPYGKSFSVKHCQSCHQKVKGQDFTFRQYKSGSH